MADHYGTHLTEKQAAYSAGYADAAVMNAKLDATRRFKATQQTWTGILNGLRPKGCKMSHFPTLFDTP
jgi:hypothetical protein